MRRMLAAVLAASVFPSICAPAHGKTIVILRGLFGEVVAPMTDYEAELKKRGHRVVMGSHRAPPQVKADYVIGHSRGADVALNYPAGKIITLDATFLNPGCPQGRQCEDYVAPVNKLPFLLCCGGYAVRGATKAYLQPGTLSFFLFAPGHVGLPSRVRDQVIQGIK